LIIVPAAINEIGRMIISRKNVPFNNPVIAPIIVLIRELKPRGAAEIKSKARPEVNPRIWPVMDPLLYEMYIKMMSVRSGIV